MGIIKIVLISFLFTISMISFSLADKNQGNKTDPQYRFERLYNCYNKLVALSDNSGRPYNDQALNGDLFYILNMANRDLFIFSPYFAGKANLDIDKEGKNIEISKDAEPITNIISLYSIRIPYFPSDPSKVSGYYYMTISDYPNHITGQHNIGIQLHPKFLPGAEPDFSKIKDWQTYVNTSGENIIDPNRMKFHHLDIEDKIWNQKINTNFDKVSEAVLISVINSKINDLSRFINNATDIGDGLGWTRDAYLKYIKSALKAPCKTYEETINFCQDVANELSLTSTQEAIKQQRMNPTQAECDSSQPS